VEGKITSNNAATILLGRTAQELIELRERILDLTRPKISDRANYEGRS